MNAPQELTSKYEGQHLKGEVGWSVVSFVSVRVGHGGLTAPSQGTCELMRQGVLSSSGVCQGRMVCGLLGTKSCVGKREATELKVAQYSHTLQFLKRVSGPWTPAGRLSLSCFGPRWPLCAFLTRFHCDLEYLNLPLFYPCRWSDGYLAGDKSLWLEVMFLRNTKGISQLFLAFSETGVRCHLWLLIFWFLICVIFFSSSFGPNFFSLISIHWDQW